MLRYKVKCKGKPVILRIGVAVRQPNSKVCIRVVDPSKTSVIYIDRWQTVQKNAEFDVRIPHSCKEVIAEIWIKDNGSPDALRITKFQLLPIQTDPRCISGGYKVKSFVKFAQFFAENAGDLATGTYYSDDKQFRFDYMPNIQANVATPARIHNGTGIFQISKQHFDAYTVPMRMAILLHEYAHFNMNVVQQDETEADLNGLKIYLGLGYPLIEAHKSFTRVFMETPSPENKRRYQYIEAFIKNYDNLKHTICI
jgi:hypothetical protein